LVAQAETELCERIDRRFGKLKDLMSMRMLNLRNDVQELGSATVFSDFPARVAGLRFRVDQAEFNAKIAKDARIRRAMDGLNAVMTRLSPIGLSAKVAENRKRLALLEQRSATAASSVTESRHRDLERSMAKLDALSPLSVLTRGYSITQKQDGEIVRDAHQTKAGEALRVRLAKGELDITVGEVREV
jgi:exodeoxyribonuclease VII large subunit